MMRDDKEVYMTKKDMIKDAIKSVNRNMDEWLAELRTIEEAEMVRFNPEMNEMYYFVGNDGVVRCRVRREMDDKISQYNRVFKTRDIAIRYFDIIKQLHALSITSVEVNDLRDGKYYTLVFDDNCGNFVNKSVLNYQIIGNELLFDRETVIKIIENMSKSDAQLLFGRIK